MGLTWDEIGGPLKSVYIAVLARAVKDAGGHTHPENGANQRRLRREAYAWVMSPEALAYCEVAGVPVAMFQRQRRTIAPPPGWTVEERSAA